MAIFRLDVGICLKNPNFLFTNGIRFGRMAGLIGTALAVIY